MAVDEAVMGRAKQRSDTFRQQHPFCCFCGGARPTEEVEHLPARACFDNKLSPEGFEFPTCRSCNASTSQEEQIVAMLSRVASHPGAEAMRVEIAKYIRGVKNNRLAAYLEMAAAAFRLPGGGGAFRIGNEIQSAVECVLTRWAKAFHYLETGLIVPTTAVIRVAWYSNASQNLTREMFEGTQRTLTRNGKGLGDQMMYIARVDRATDPDLGRYTVAFRRAFLALMLVDFTGRAIGNAAPMGPE